MNSRYTLIYLLTILVVMEHVIMMVWSLEPLCEIKGTNEIGETQFSVIEKNDLQCKVESGVFQTKPYTKTRDIIIMEYNIDRNGMGGDGSREQGLKPIIELIQGKKSARVPSPDILILSEVSRGCKRFGNFSNGAQEIARELQMNYVYGVEFLEVDWTHEEGVECTVGNAILTKFPISSFGSLRFEHQCCMYGGRAGGRMAVYANINPMGNLSRNVNDTNEEYVNNSQIPFISVYSTHLESGGSSLKEIVESIETRFHQAKEIINHAKNSSNSGVIVGGDLNAPLMDIDPTVAEFLINHFHDTFIDIPIAERCTCPDSPLAKYHLANLDYIFTYSDYLQFRNATICSEKYEPECRGLSDHVPIWVMVSTKNSSIKNN